MTPSSCRKIDELPPWLKEESKSTCVFFWSLSDAGSAWIPPQGNPRRTPSHPAELQRGTPSVPESLAGCLPRSQQRPGFRVSDGRAAHPADRCVFMPRPQERREVRLASCGRDATRHVPSVLHNETKV
ncbi:hypothetical protein NDU88_003188 [Pleurodeles waltl]|uniref:Uncharacterized protein n=1 Tax=Pleurodeles waltl TaxID=8319 RepID=A0AAV7T3Y9_PLEWA|nr:hypothetical protein NDU88_003188 [Pleurodeles waltl]